MQQDGPSSKHDNEFGEELDSDLYADPRLNAFSGESEASDREEEPVGAQESQRTNAVPAASRYQDALNSEDRAYEEYAAEIAAPAPLGASVPARLNHPEEDRPEGTEARRNKVEPAAAAGAPAAADGRLTGWVAMALAIASLFVWPVVLGLASVLIGTVAYWRGSRVLGLGAIVVGLVAFIVYIAILPYYS